MFYIHIFIHIILFNIYYLRLLNKSLEFYEFYFYLKNYKEN
jgi:hypothetical protein